jgi:hypothetical protein
MQYYQKRKARTRTRMCALCRSMHMYFVTPNRLTPARVCCVTQALQYLFPDIHHYFPTSGNRLVNARSCIPSLPSPFEAHSSEVEKAEVSMQIGSRKRP